jgi:acyl-CoA hydrolase
MPADHPDAASTPARESRPPAATVSVLTYRTGIQDANVAGNVHGGWVMKLSDDVAVIAATRLAGGRVVTAAVDEMRFQAPVRVGDVVTLRATVNATWRTSMEVGVRVESEDVQSGRLTHVCSAYLTMVALDEDGKPTPLPAIAPVSEEDERRAADAALRREVRLARPEQLRRVTS